MATNTLPFSLWLEFEAYADTYPGPDDDPECDFCNASITIDDIVFGINIWTFGFVEYARSFDETSGEAKPEKARFLIPPDLLVDRLDRTTIEHAIHALLSQGSLPSHWIGNESTKEST